MEFCDYGMLWLWLAGWVLLLLLAAWVFFSVYRLLYKPFSLKLSLGPLGPVIHRMGGLALPLHLGILSTPTLFLRLHHHRIKPSISFLKLSLALMCDQPTNTPSS